MAGKRKGCLVNGACTLGKGPFQRSKEGVLDHHLPASSELLSITQACCINEARAAFAYRVGFIKRTGAIRELLSQQ